MGREQNTGIGALIKAIKNQDPRACGACGEVIQGGHSCPAILRGYEQGRAEVIALVGRSARHPHKGPDDTDASMLRDAAQRLRGGYEPGGSWTKQTVANVISTVADLMEEADRA